MIQPSLWIDNHFTGWTSEENLQAVENIPAQDAFAASKVRLQAAGVFLPVKLSPDQKSERCRGTTCNTTDQTLYSHSRSELQKLTIRPRQDAGICPRIGNHSIQHD